MIMHAGWGKHILHWAEYSASVSEYSSIKVMIVEFTDSKWGTSQWVEQEEWADNGQESLLC